MAHVPGHTGVHLISFPFRIGLNGSVVTRPDDSSDYYAEQLAQMCLTKPGERPQVPLYGINDPTYHQIDAQELAYKVDLFGPPVRIVSVTSQYVSATEQDVRVEFAPLQNEFDLTER